MASDDEADRDVVAVKVMLALAKMNPRPGTRRAAYRAAGLHLARLRAGRTRLAWAALVKAEIGIGKRRAYQLMAAGDRGRSLAPQAADGALAGRGG